MASKRDYYNVLEVDRSVDETSLKKAFRRLAMQYHPDRNPDPAAKEKFQELQEAYEVLSDSQKRAIYDQFGHEGLKGRMGGPHRNMDDIFAGFSSIFEDFFGAAESNLRGQDLRYRLKISFREAVLGCEKEISLRRRESCKDCKGTGAANETRPEECRMCEGRGKIRRQQGFFVIQQDCPQCGGEGQIIKDPCRTCEGSGLVENKANLSVQIPAGIDSGMRLRMNGEGESIRAGGPRGDLYVEVEVEEDEFFERDNADLYGKIYIPYATAALGGRVIVPLVEGETEIDVPAGVQTPHTVSLKGEGIKDLRSRARGDLHIELHIATPQKLSPRAKDLLRELSDELGDEKPSAGKKRTKKKSRFF